MRLRERISRSLGWYFFDKVAMVELKDEIVVICELEIVQRGHEHDLGNGELFDPILVPLYS